MAKYTKADREEAIAQLREILPEGSTVHCILRHVSRSGMRRRITFIAILGKDNYLYLDGMIAPALGYSQASHGEGLVVDGCGMDMGFQVVHSLSYALHGMPNKLENKSRRGYTLTHRWI